MSTYEDNNFISTRKNFNAKQWILYGITGLVIIASFIALFIPFITIYIFNNEFYSFNLFEGAFGEKFNSVFEDEILFIRIISYVHLSLLAISFSTFITALFKKQKMLIDNLSSGILIFTLLIALAEIAFSKILQNPIPEETSGLATATSSSWIFALLVFILDFIFILCKKYIPDTFKVKSSQNKTTENNNKQAIIADTLLKYHNLLKLGAITEEEFEKKKKELLGE